MSWLNASVLGLAALAVVPIILHFWLRERVQKVMFSALRFLQKQNKDAFLRKRWLEWLLAAVRVICVLVLVVAFARPFAAAAPQEEGKSGHATIVLLDISRSMGVGDHFAQAVAEAERVIKAAPENDTFTVITFADASNIGVLPGSTPTMALEGLRSVKVAGGGTDILAAVDRVLTVAHASSGDVHLISDLQSTGIPTNRDAPRLPQNYTLQIHRMGTAKGSETAAISLLGGAFTTNITPGERNLTASIRVSNSGAARAIDAQLKVGGQLLDQKKIALPQNGETAVTLTGTLREPGEFSAAIVLPDAPVVLKGDNQFQFVVRVVSRVKVLIVDPAPNREDRSLDSAFFVTEALNVGADSPYAAEVVQMLPDLKPYQVVILPNVSLLGAGDVAKLKAFVSAGGGLLIGAGAGLDAEGFNRSIGELAPAHVRAMATDDAGRFLVAVDPTHTLVSRLVDEGKADLSAPRFHAVADLKDSQGAHVILRFDDHRPALLERRLGKGQVLMLASGLDRRSGDFPLRPIFLPFLHEAMRLLVAEANQSQNLLTGDTLAVPADATLTMPDNSQVKGGAEASNVVLAEPGIYRLVAGSAATLYAVNADPRESNLAAAEPADVEKMLMPARTGVLRAAHGTLERVLMPNERLAAEHRLNIGYWCLVALAGLVFAELLLAQYASRQ